MSSISDKYVEALKQVEGWATVSAWAIKVGEVYPDLLEKANREAENQKNPTTGIREIAARISSRISTGGFTGHIEVDESERPRKVRIISETDLSTHVQRDIEEDIEPLTCDQKIKSDLNTLNTKEMYRPHASFF
jgi:hypothetical protein